MFAWFNARKKAIASLFGVAILIASYKYGSTNEWVQLAIAAGTVLGVYGVSNTDGSPALPPDTRIATISVTDTPPSAQPSGTNDPTQPAGHAQPNEGGERLIPPGGGW